MPSRSFCPSPVCAITVAIFMWRDGLPTMGIGCFTVITEELTMCETFDPVVVESILLGYRMPTATKADRAAAVQILTARGLISAEVAARCHVTERTVERLRDCEVVPLPELPEWAHDYERQWPTCPEGHEQTPDNVAVRIDKRNGHQRSECRMCSAKRRKEQRRQKVNA